MATGQRDPVTGSVAIAPRLTADREGLEARVARPDGPAGNSSQGLADAVPSTVCGPCRPPQQA